MSISSSLNNALSGLTAASRAADIVSSNIANAQTEGYGRRRLDTSSRVLGGSGSGVFIDGTTRIVDQVVINDRRVADAGLAASTTMGDFLKRIETVIGAPGDPGSLSDRLAGLDASLIEAASRPDSEPRLQNVLRSAQGLTDHLNTISNEIQNQRMQADQSIDQQVRFLNDSLQKIQKLNSQILAQNAGGREVSGLMDQRQVAIDRIAEIVPLKEVPRARGQVALITTGGAILLDGRASTIGFTSVGIITPDMTLDAGSLSGLTINDTPITSNENGILSGGSLAASFSIRDSAAITAQENLDAVARDIVERFQDPSVDTTLGPLDAGLFTDNNAFFDPLNEEGLAGRISINERVDPTRGGKIWRLRDGIGAAVAGNVGNGSLLQTLSTTLTENRVPVSGSFIGAARSVVGLAGDFLSMIASDRQGFDASRAFSTAKVDALKAQELQGGVDTDYEMQQLLLVEQSYSANARVIKTLETLMDTLLRI